MVFWFTGGGEPASTGDEQGQRWSEREQYGLACGIPRAVVALAFFSSLLSRGGKCGADLTYTRVQIERLWFD